MAGRGGRGGKSSTFTHEQLQALGCVGNDMPSVTIAPPPLFPALLTKPVPLETNADREYKILWKEDFMSYLRDSPYFSKKKNSDCSLFQRYSDSIVKVIENDPKTNLKCEFNWDAYPSELRPNFKRSKPDKEKVKAKRTKQTKDITDTLKMLEEKEKNEMKSIKVEKDDDEDDDEENDVEDDEMDDENDYGDNYFDNGEAFNEEDDNLDDGPIY